MAWAPVGRVFGAPRVCGDDPRWSISDRERRMVLPAYAGMIPNMPPIWR